jgi:hypothetical protein
MLFPGPLENSVQFVAVLFAQDKQEKAQSTATYVSPLLVFMPADSHSIVFGCFMKFTPTSGPNKIPVPCCRHLEVFLVGDFGPRIGSNGQVAYRRVFGYLYDHGSEKWL